MEHKPEDGKNEGLSTYKSNEVNPEEKEKK